MPKKSGSRIRKINTIWKFLPAALSVLIVLSALLFATILAKNNQDIREQAAVNTSNVNVTLRSGSPDDSHLRIDVFINTQGYKLAGADIQGSLTNTSPQNVKIEAGNTLAVSSVQDKVLQDGSLTKFRGVKFASLDPNAQTSTHGQDILLFSLIVTQPTDKKVSISFNQTGSMISLVGNPANVSTIYPGTQTLALLTQSDLDNNRKSCNQNCATDPECKSDLRCYKGMCRKSSNLEDQYCGTPPDQGIHRSCNEYCADNRECDSKYVCYFNRCRNPKNQTSTSCAVPVATTRVTTSSSGSGKGGTTTTSTPKATPTPVASPTNIAVVSIDGRDLTTPTPSPIIFTSPSVSPTLIVETIKPTPSPSPTPAPNQVSSGSVKNMLGIAFILVGIAGLVGGGIWLFKKYST
jgi:hypothetical protein